MTGDNGYSTKGLYKSEGERRIAGLLDDAGIDYVYKPGVLVEDGGMQRVWQPNFGLPRYAVYLEYFGIEGDPAYQKETLQKLEVYRRMDLAVVPVYPRMLRGDYRREIIGEIYKKVESRLSDLEARVYQAGFRPPMRKTFARYNGGGSTYR